MINEGMFTSCRDDWATPPELFKKLDAIYGPFDLDVCASETNHKCKSFFSKEQDGLAQSWRGHACFCNPPYGREIGKWVKKCYQESKEAYILALLPSRTDTAWFQDYILPYARIYFWRGRIKFDGAKNSAPFPSLIAIWGKN